MSRADLLVVEDEPIVIEASGKVLRPEGLNVEGAEDASAGEAKMRARRYRLLLFDLMLPGRSGLELLEIAGRLQPGVPAIVISGYASYQKTLAAFGAGAFDFLPKPFDVEELLGVVHRGLRYGEMEAGDAGQAPVAGAATYWLGDHAWARIEGDEAITVGVGRSFVPLAGEVERVSLPARGAEVVQGGELARLVDRRREVHRVWSPLSGQVLEVDATAAAIGPRLRDDPVGAGWLVALRPTAPDGELEALAVR